MTDDARPADDCRKCGFLVRRREPEEGSAFYFAEFYDCSKRFRLFAGRKTHHEELVEPYAVCDIRRQAHASAQGAPGLIREILTEVQNINLLVANIADSRGMAKVRKLFDVSANMIAELNLPVLSDRDFEDRVAALGNLFDKVELDPLRRLAQIDPASAEQQKYRSIRLFEAWFEREGVSCPEIEAWRTLRELRHAHRLTHDNADWGRWLQKFDILPPVRPVEHYSRVLQALRDSLKAVVAALHGIYAK